MFSKINNYRDQYSKSTISIEDLYKIVKNNPQDNIIKEMRCLEYKSSEYDNLKSKLSCITPHGIFNKIENKGLVEFSNYFFYDIDNYDTIDELNDTINRLIDTFPISFLQRSVSNKGFHFLIKCDTTIQPNDTYTFINIHKYIASLLIDKGFNIDKSATGIVRRMVISSDVNVYFNNKVSLGIDMVSFYNFIEELNKSNGNIKQKRDNDIKPNDTLSNEIISMDLLKTQIKFKSEYTNKINGDYTIDEMDFYFIATPKIIKDGTKHKLYTRIINGLYYLNPEINRQQVLSYLYYINNRATPQMDFKQLKRLVEYVCNGIEENGEIKVKTRTKKIHFNNELNLDKKQKQKMGASINGKLRRNETIKTINEAREELLKKNIEPTQKKVMEMTGFSIATIKRNWNIDYLSTEVEVPQKENDKMDINIQCRINEDEFFETKKDIVKFKYRGFEEVSIERSIGDKETFKSVLNDVKNEFGDISEDIMTPYLIKEGWDKYKINYYYTNYVRIKNQII